MVRLLMCRPDFYAIQYEINPWMSRRRNAVPEVARAQWERLYHVLTQEVGAQVELVEPVPGLPDMVFTANAGLVHLNLFLPANFRYPERQGEAPYFRLWFQERGYQGMELPPDLYFEGEGDVMAVGENLFAGYRFRSDIRSHLFLAEVFSRRALSLELVDPRFYHLDTCFCPLDDNCVLYYPGAFDSYGLRVIHEYIPDRIEVGLEEALRFVCNAVVVGKTVVLNAGCPETKRGLEQKGYRVYEVDLSEFIKAGGAAKCLVLFLSR